MKARTAARIASAHIQAANPKHTEAKRANWRAIALALAYAASIMERQPVKHLHD